MQQLPFVLAFPPKYTLIDPEWKLSCGNSRLGLHDPPRTLNKASYLVDPTLVGTQTPTAAPGGRPAPGPIAATPTPTATSGGKSPARLPTMSPGLRGSDPPAGPVLKIAAISNIMSNLQSPPYPDKPESSDSKAAGDPHRAVGNIEKNSDPGSSNDFEDFRGEPTKTPTEDDPPLSSLRDIQIQEASGGGIIIGSTVLRPGDQTAQAGTSISVGNGFIVVGGSMIHLTAPTRGVSYLNRIPETTLNSVNVDHYTPVVAFGGENISGSTYSPGTQSRTSGTAVSVDSYNIVVDGATYALLPHSSQNPVVIAGQTITKASNSGVMIGSSNYPPGAQATLSGTVLSVGSDNVVLGSSTYALPSNLINEPTLVDDNTITRAPDGGVIIGDFTIAPGGQTTFSGQKITVGVSSVVVDGSAFALPTSARATASRTILSQSLTLANQVVISAGGPTYHIPADNSRPIIENDKTTRFPTRPPSVSTISGQPFSAVNPTGFENNGQSISSDGSAIAASSLPSLALPIPISTTTPLTTSAHTVGLGGVIITGFDDDDNVTGSAANISRPLRFAGGSVRLRGGMVLLSAAFGLAVVCAL